MISKRETSLLPRPRSSFLLLLAIGITGAFLWVIRDFVVVLVEAAALAAVAYPLSDRLAERLGGRRRVASGLILLLGLLVVVLPGLLFLGVLVEQAVQVSEAGRAWLATASTQLEAWQEELGQHPTLEQLLPNQDQILEKTGQLAAKVGSLVAGGLSSAASGTARTLLLLFVLLAATYSFLVDGRELVQGLLRFTPLSDSDKDRLVDTFSSVGRATLKGTLIVGVVQGSLAGLSFWAAGIEGSLFWAVVMTVLSLDGSRTGDSRAARPAPARERSRHRARPELGRV